eukprot:GHVR01132680.1.p1 GENE.GHVR01132680.1~~GHVR01132680.1.p1  ORF type:complete len:448 (+),score=79.06 GHVR01132680.1:36-1379(+)
MKNLLLSLSGALYAGAIYVNYKKIDDVNFKVSDDANGTSYNGIMKGITSGDHDEYEPEYNAFCTGFKDKSTMCPIRVQCEIILASLGNGSMCYLTEDLPNVSQVLVEFSYNKKIEFMSKLIDDVLLFFYDMADNPNTKYYPPREGNQEEDGRRYRQGLTHCDMTPNNILVSKSDDSNYEFYFTGFLGKHKNIENGKYIPALDTCISGEGDPKYYSILKATRYAQEIILKSNPSSDKIERAEKILKNIEELYNRALWDNLASLLDDVWSSMLTIKEMCNPSSTFDKFVQEMLVTVGKSDDVCKEVSESSNYYKQYMTVCYKAVLYYNYFDKYNGNPGEQILFNQHEMRFQHAPMEVRIPMIAEFFDIASGECERSDDDDGLGYKDIVPDGGSTQKESEFQFRQKMGEYSRQLLAGGMDTQFRHTADKIREKREKQKNGTYNDDNMFVD